MSKVASAAPLIFPFPDHVPVKTGSGFYRLNPPVVMKGWWPSRFSGRDVTGRKL